MGRVWCDTPKERIEILLCVRQMYFPEQPLNWEYLLDKIAVRCVSDIHMDGVPFQERMRFLFICGMSDRMETLPFKVWRDHISHMIRTAVFDLRRDNSGILRSIREKLAHFEVELPKLKEVTTILELAMWKVRMHENDLQDTMNRQLKKLKTDKSSSRQQCRVTCGADVIIGHVLPFLL